MIIDLGRLLEDAAAESQRDIAAWLGEVERTRDLNRIFVPRDAAGSGYAAAASAFVESLRAEMIDFRVIVEAALTTAETNERQLRSIVANTGDQSAMVQRAASAVAELDTSAKHVADIAAALRRMTGDLENATTHFDAGVDDVIASLARLSATIDSAHGFASAMDHGSDGIATFLSRLRTIARQARVLGINAAIEAAHLGEAGAGFVIVAEEVKKLASSTAESAVSVGQIEKELQTASDRVGIAIGESAIIIGALATEVAAAQGRSAQSRAQVSELDAAITDVSASSTSRSVKLSSIAQNVERSAEHARNVQSAAERASRLDLQGALERLQAAISCYTLGDRAATAQIVALDEASFGAIALPAAESLRGRVDEDQRELLALVNHISVAVARNTYEWKEIAASLEGLRAAFRSTADAIDDTTHGANLAAGASQRMRVALEALRAGFATSVEALERSLDAVTRVRETVQHAESFVAATAAAGERASSILELIDSISSETTLLSLNAAIEAAHAGDAGSGFGIIADEIRKLADTTLGATQQIGSVLAGVSGASGSMSDTTASAVAQTIDVGERTEHMRGTVNGVRAQLEHTLSEAGEVAAIVEQQFTAIADVRSAATLALTRIDTDFSAVTDGRRLDLANLGTQAHALAARRPLGTIAEAVRSIGLAVAVRMDGVFDEAIARGEISLEDCFDTAYEEIAGAKIVQLGRLFDVSSVPPQGFTPPKFATRYDRAIEDGFNTLIDATVPDHPAIKAMFAVDLNGFCFGHYHECRRAWTGDYTTDLNHNRIKRFFEDELSLRCSRTGLGPGSRGLPARTPRSEFAAHGCTLVHEGARPWAIYTYARDTGIVYNDLSVALFAQGQRIGTIRIIYNADVV
ncbi:MAG: hypothetical protein NVS2B17_06540 [Candidatus Velthaea sp.]